MGDKELKSINYVYCNNDDLRYNEHTLNAEVYSFFTLGIGTYRSPSRKWKSKMVVVRV